MRKNLLFRFAPLAACAAVFAASSAAQEPADAGDAPTGAVLQTDLGEIEIRLFADRAPETVANFVRYARDGHYDGLIFHRVIPGFVIQGGGLTPDLRARKTRAPVRNESDNGVKNKKHTLSMARLPDPNSATSQFFINLADNANLDFRAPDNWGYAVFAEVTRGFEVVAKIAAAPTATTPPHRDVPTKPIAVRAVKILP